MVEPASTPLPSAQTPGLIVGSNIIRLYSSYDFPQITTVVAFVSILALLSVAFRWAWMTAKSIFSPSKNLVSPEPTFYRNQLALYAACLLAGNTFISIAGLFGLSWLTGNGIHEGELL
jgi:hypothetical protein